MRNAVLEEAQAGIKIVGRNINNLRYTDDTTLRAESQEQLKGFLMKVKEKSEKDGKTQHSKNKYHDLITSWQIDGKTMETVIDLICLGSKISTDGDCSQENKRLTKSSQCIKKHRHHFANKYPYSQSYVFSRSHVWM